ncbi:MAG: Ribulose-phosphate 3-epimerase, partial [uncultured Ramlibacter sp.]
EQNPSHRALHHLGRFRQAGRRAEAGHRSGRGLDPLRRDGQPLRAQPDVRADGVLRIEAACAARRRLAGAGGRAPDGAAGGCAGAGVRRSRRRLHQLPSRRIGARPPQRAGDQGAWLQGRTGVQPGCAAGRAGLAGRRDRPGADHERQPRLRGPRLHRLVAAQDRAGAPTHRCLRQGHPTGGRWRHQAGEHRAGGGRRRRHLRGRQRDLRQARLQGRHRRHARRPERL